MITIIITGVIALIVGFVLGYLLINMTLKYRSKGEIPADKGRTRKTSECP